MEVKWSLDFYVQPCTSILDLCRKDMLDNTTREGRLNRGQWFTGGVRPRSGHHPQIWEARLPEQTSRKDKCALPISCALAGLELRTVSHHSRYLESGEQGYPVDAGLMVVHSRNIGSRLVSGGALAQGDQSTTGYHLHGTR